MSRGDYIFWMKSVERICIDICVERTRLSTNRWLQRLIWYLEYSFVMAFIRAKCIRLEWSERAKWYSYQLLWFRETPANSFNRLPNCIIFGIESLQRVPTGKSSASGPARFLISLNGTQLFSHPIFTAYLWLDPSLKSLYLYSLWSRGCFLVSSAIGYLG